MTFRPDGAAGTTLPCHSIDFGRRGLTIHIATAILAFPLNKVPAAMTPCPSQTLATRRINAIRWARGSHPIDHAASSRLTRANGDAQVVVFDRDWSAENQQ